MKQNNLKTIDWEEYNLLKINEALSGKRYRVTPSFLKELRAERDAYQKSLKEQKNDSTKK